MKDLLPLIGIIAAVLAFVLIYLFNKESRKLREELATNEKKKKRQRLELYDSLKGFINMESLTIIFQVINIDEQANVKVTQLSREIQALKRGEEILKLKDVSELKDEINFHLSNNILELDDTLDLLLDKIKQIKEEKGIDDDEQGALIE